MPILGIYEKALPKNINWLERLSIAKENGFKYVEISIDETDERLQRLDWSKKERLDLVDAKLQTGIGVHSMCLSAHRRFSFGSQIKNNEIRAKEIMEKSIDFAYDTGIRTIQLAGYDTYPEYEPNNEKTKAQFIENLNWAVVLASEAQVMLSMEIMDTEFLSSITRWKEYDTIIQSPWFTVYPDVGNLSAWSLDVNSELAKGIDKIAAIHLKDTLSVTKDKVGTFKNVPFGSGCVDFIKIFKQLKALNYRGSFVVEQWSESSSDPIGEILKSKKWLLEQMALAGFNRTI